MRDLDEAFRNKDGLATIKLYGTEGRYRSAFFNATEISHPRYGIINIDHYGIVDTHTNSLMLTTYCDSFHIAGSLLAAANSILNEGLALEKHEPDWNPGCDRFRIEEMPDSDSGPQICIIDGWPPRGVFPYLLYGLLGTREDEIRELTTRVVEGLNRRGYNYAE